MDYLLALQREMDSGNVHQSVYSEYFILHHCAECGNFKNVHNLLFCFPCLPSIDGVQDDDFELLFVDRELLIRPYEIFGCILHGTNISYEWNIRKL